eukprot:SM000183S03968  [mRNA]  locus=s183:79381:81688:- [translate_table: standard]
MLLLRGRCCRGRQVAYGLLLAGVPVVPLLPRFPWSASAYFLLLALWAVYVGSHRSLRSRSPRTLSMGQSVAVPLACSVSLLGLYTLLRLFPDLDLRTFVAGYLSLAGAAAVASNLVGPLRALLPHGARALERRAGEHRQVPITAACKRRHLLAYKSTASTDLTRSDMAGAAELPLWLVKEEGQPVHITVTLADVLAATAGIAVVVASRQAGALFTLNNFVAACIVTELLQLVSLSSFPIAAAMLSGLLVYDVFWVFGSPHIFGESVMVTVATSASLDGPMKLVFPHWSALATKPYSILGLGDIAAPGLLMALMLRFDQSQSSSMRPSKQLVGGDDAGPLADPEAGGATWSKYYFLASIASYTFGLAVTIGVNATTGAAQPALLYLVPSVLGGISLAALLRSELGLLLAYKDEHHRP